MARSAVDDALLTRDHLRGVAAATYTASLASDGTIERTTLTAVQQALLRGQAETLETIATSGDARYPSTPGDAAADATPRQPRTSSPCGATTSPSGRKPASPASRLSACSTS